MTRSYSIVIPAFGEQKLLDLCLGTIAKQTLPAHEVIVVDDGSKPPLTVPEGVRLVRIARGTTAEHRGSSAAKNLGASYAAGNYLVFVDASVLLLPETLSCMNDTFMAYEKLGEQALLNVWRIGLTKTYDEVGDMNQFLRDRRDEGVVNGEDFEDGRLCYEQNCGGMRADLFWAIGGYNEKGLPGWGFNNHDLCLRAVEAGIRVSSNVRRVTSRFRLVCFHNWHEAPADVPAAKEEFKKVWGKEFSPGLFHDFKKYADERIKIEAQSRM